MRITDHSFSYHVEKVTDPDKKMNRHQAHSPADHLESGGYPHFIRGDLYPAGYRQISACRFMLCILDVEDLLASAKRGCSADDPNISDRTKPQEY